ncbi:alpha/beta fold hydrolase [Mycobacterium sp. 050134]|uniref:alpha/beta fold hydrolase n=1 Tax=Mycobacterium sp. 050134 TaxID=3096111 RepID=UPI002ED94039
MTQPPALVFLHGGCHSSGSWAPTISALIAQQPGIDAFAVDLPGRRHIDGDLASLSLEVGTASVVNQIGERIDANRSVVLIGHSLAGVIIPGVVHRLGEKRVKRLIFVACCVPPAGKSVIDTIPVVVRLLARPVVRKPIIDTVPFLITRFIFGNKASRAQRAQIRRNLCPESTALITNTPKALSLNNIPAGWIMPTHDRALPPRLQRTFMTRLGGLDQVVTIDAGHEVPITHPGALAEVIGAMVE